MWEVHLEQGLESTKGTIIHNGNYPAVGLYGLSQTWKSKGGIENVLVVIDHFINYAQAYPTHNQIAKTTARNMGFLVLFLCILDFPSIFIVIRAAILKANLLKPYMLCQQLRRVEQPHIILWEMG